MLLNSTTLNKTFNNYRFTNKKITKVFKKYILFILVAIIKLIMTLSRIN